MLMPLCCIPESVPVGEDADILASMLGDAMAGALTGMVMVDMVEMMEMVVMVA